MNTEKKCINGYFVMIHVGVIVCRCLTFFTPIFGIILQSRLQRRGKMLDMTRLRGCKAIAGQSNRLEQTVSTYGRQIWLAWIVLPTVTDAAVVPFYSVSDALFVLKPYDHPRRQGLDWFDVEPLKYDAL